MACFIDRNLKLVDTHDLNYPFILIIISTRNEISYKLGEDPKELVVTPCPI